MNETIIIGMSGGVDSAVSAALLIEKGYNVEAVFMKNWDEEDIEFCTAAEDYKDALQVCEELGIPCLLYTSPSPRDLSTSRMPSSA